MARRTAKELWDALDQATAFARPRRARGAFDPVAFRARQDQRRGLIIGVSVGAAILVVALVVLASVLSRMFGDVGGPLDKQQLGLNNPSSSTTGTAGAVVIAAAYFLTFFGSTCTAHSQLTLFDYLL